MVVRSPESPADVAGRLFRALETEAWLDAAACIDPAVREYRYDFALNLWRRQREPEMDAERISEAVDSFAPPMRVMVRKWIGTMPEAFRGADSIEELEAMSALDFMARTLARSTDAVRSAASTGFIARESPLEAVRVQILRVILAIVPETDDRVHVVYRRILKRNERAHLLQPIGLAEFHRQPSGWFATVPPPPGATIEGTSDMQWHRSARQTVIWF
jgi:hypothetical protein